MAEAITEVLSRLLVVDENAAESVRFLPHAEEELCDAIDRHLESEDLLDVVNHLFESMYVLEVEGRCPTAAKLIAKALERETVTRALKGVASRWRTELTSNRIANASSEAEAVNVELKRLSDVEMKRNAPVHGAGAPAGTVKVSSFAVPRKLS